jgi:cyclopropane fatty-acyl-phospholipid synthase-like methyltransferase
MTDVSRDMDDEPTRIVAAGYDSVADRYERLEQAGAEWPRLRRLRELLLQVPERGAVLDLGCGNGVPALREIARRHRATGVDVSAVQAERARRNVPGATVLNADMAELELEDGSFDAVVSFYAVEHVRRARHAELFGRVHAWLKPGGLFLFTVEAREGFEDVGTWLGEPMFFSQLDEEEMLQLLHDVGLIVVSREREEQLEGGSPIEYLWVLARRDE